MATTTLSSFVDIKEEGSPQINDFVQKMNCAKNLFDDLLNELDNNDNGI